MHAVQDFPGSATEQIRGGVHLEITEQGAIGENDLAVFLEHHDEVGRCVQQFRKQRYIGQFPGDLFDVFPLPAFRGGIGSLRHNGFSPL